ncbi:MAG: beta-hydroxyacyl-ACP dehydratase [Buchnera aphidicola (Periphyllus aceris)]|nr:beta-hydroxyacyl-ACP dehydratase [Buchnera aphidicola (Periphyllus aceris)]
MNKNNFLKFILHRYPFLFIDKVICFEKQIYLISKFRVRPDIFFFSGHFPKNPIFPGVLILESMMQSAGILCGMSYKNIFKKLYYLTTIKNAKFKRLVFPNDILNIKIFFLNHHKNFIKFHGFAFVKDLLVCEAIITIYIQ